ncbi:unnamed protein product [Lampetra planeri]
MCTEERWVLLFDLQARQLKARESRAVFVVARCCAPWCESGAPRGAGVNTRQASLLVRVTWPHRLNRSDLFALIARSRVHVHARETSHGVPCLVSARSVNRRPCELRSS